MFLLLLVGAMRTAVYAIVNRHKSGDSKEPWTLEQLASETGGRIYFHPRGVQIWDELKTIDEEQRNQYRLVYRPAVFKANGKFHCIKLGCSVKCARIVARSGYCAFVRP